LPEPALLASPLASSALVVPAELAPLLAVVAVPVPPWFGVVTAAPEPATLGEPLAPSGS
jgi:hypothetical protein